MSTKTTIEWTDASWNPIRGCSLVSAGCANCYAMKTARRFSGPGQPYEGLTELGPRGPRWNGKILLVPQLLDEPLHWKQPRRVFVNSMSDLFHEDVPQDFIAQVFLTMNQTPQHSYQILTKRPQRMLEFSRTCESMARVNGSWPMPNVWLGVSVEDQATADERIPILLKTPAAVRFISAEPLLGPIYIRKYLAHDSQNGRGISWVILGGESGPKARPTDLAWIRSLKDQCQEAGTKVFVKQVGAVPYVDNDLEGGLQYVEASDRGLDLPGYVMQLKDKKGGDISEFPHDLKVREYPR